MAGLRLENLTKKFGPVLAVDDVTLEVADGEFLAVLGPSGCGKTTILRMIAGFEKVSDGRIAIGDMAVSGPGKHVPAEKRRVGIVFQSYALWPHMNVRRNVGYSLEVLRTPREEYTRRVNAALKTVDMVELADRRPADLSGGQRQRVALARCLVMEPSMVLLDEPLANLDVHLRAAMEEEFSAFHRKTGATMIYITHDQAEAMALADRIAVMDAGKIVQVCEPKRLYREPGTSMVANFIGEGAVVGAKVLEITEPNRCTVDLLGAQIAMRCGDGQQTGPADVSLRPENLLLINGDCESGTFHGLIKRATYQGGSTAIEIEPQGTPGQHLLMVLSGENHPKPGERVTIQIAGGWVIPG